MQFECNRSVEVKNQEESTTNSATRFMVTGMGVIFGIVGIQHGVLEILQGNIPTGSILIDAIGPGLELWEGAREPAITLIPNFLITGILATVVSIVIIVWSIGFVHKKHGALILFTLGVIQFLVGGGITPFELCIPASLAATRINKPLIWWQKYLPELLRRGLARVWGMLIVLYSVLFIVTISITIIGLGFLDAAGTIKLLYVLGLSTLGLMLIGIAAGFAKDIVRNEDNIVKS